MAALAVVAAPIVISVGPANAQVPAELDLAKSVSQPTAAPGEDFIFFLSYSCSLTEACVGATVSDTLPPELSRAAAEVQFGGNFADVAYNPATGTALFTLFSPLPAGTTAQISITAHFPAGTAPGTVATNQASMSAGNAATVESNAVTVTATAASPWRVTKTGVTSVPQLDTPFTYRVSITLDAGGTQNVSNARFVDTLPPGAQFVSATGGGVYDPGTHTVAWSLGTLVPDANNDVTVSREVTVLYPSTTFQAGDTPINNVEAFGTPAGGADQSLGRASYPVTLREAAPLTGAAKSSTLASLAVGQSDTYTITGTNPNAGSLDAFTIREDLPVQLSMVQDGAPNLTGTGTAPQVSWRSIGGGSFQAIATSPSGGGWGATLPTNADEIELAYGTVGANFSATAQVRAGIPANGIARDGVPVPIGANVRNCMTVTATSGGIPAVARSSCTDQAVTSGADGSTASAGGPYSAPEGSPVSLSGSTAPDVPGATYTWDVDGDGQFNDAAGPTPTVSASTLEGIGLGDGPDSTAVRVGVIAGVTFNTSTATTLVITNVAPTATFANNGPVTIGNTADVTFSAQSDPSSADTTAGFRYAYDFDNDGDFEVGDGTYAGGATSASATIPTTILNAAGPFTVAARIIDKDGGFTPHTTTITVQSPNVAPTADAGPDQTVNQGTTLTLDGTGSTDPDMDPLTYSWIQTAGPAASLTGADTSTPDFTAPTGPATLTFELKVCDNAATPLCDTDTVTVTVRPPPIGPPQPPPPPPPPPTVVCAGLEVTVDLTLGQTPTNGPDVIRGTTGADIINGLGGDDVICGDGGADIISGNQGQDRMFGGAGDDQMRGNAGDDILRGRAGDDLLYGQAGNDTLDGETSTDTCRGGTGTDTATACETTVGVP